MMLFLFFRRPIHPNTRLEHHYETDDYTQVVAYINEEFLRIQEEEERKSGGTAEKIAQEIAQEIGSSQTVENQIVELLIKKPESTRNELAEQLGISPDNMKYRLNKLRAAGRIKHEGSTKAGKWVVLEP